MCNEETVLNIKKIKTIDFLIEELSIVKNWVQLAAFYWTQTFSPSSTPRVIAITFASSSSSRLIVVTSYQFAASPTQLSVFRKVFEISFMASVLHCYETAWVSCNKFADFSSIEMLDLQ